MGSKLDDAQDSLNDGALSERLADELQRRIVLGEMSVGSWLRHASLAEEFGVSRTPVREALRMLQARGAVEVVRNRGARVVGPSPRDLRDLADVRAELEGYAAALSAERMRDDQLAELSHAWNGFREAIAEFVAHPDDEHRRRSGDRWVQANGRFHSLVVDGAGNRQLQRSVEELHRRMPRNISFAALSGDSRLLLRNVDEHERIAAAIAAHDAVAARAAMTEHIRGAGALVARHFEDQLEADRARSR